MVRYRTHLLTRPNAVACGRDNVQYSTRELRWVTCQDCLHNPATADAEARLSIPHPRKNKRKERP